MQTIYQKFEKLHPVKIVISHSLLYLKPVNKNEETKCAEKKIILNSSTCIFKGNGEF